MTGRPSTRDALAVVFAVLMVSSVALTGTAAAVPAATDPQVEPSQEEGPDLANRTADHIYRFENGSAVLVYEEEPAGEDVSTAQFGADVSSAVVDAVVVSDYQNQNDVTGQFGVTVRPDSVTGDGNLTVAAPEQLESLNATVNGVFTPEESSAQATLDATFTESSTTLDAASTNGEFVVAPDTFTLNTEYSAEYAFERDRPDTHRNYTVEETATGYDVTVDERRVISRFVRERWNTSERARQTLQEQYRRLAEQYDGNAEVTIQSYDYTEAESSTEQDVLDIEYTVTLTDVEQGVADQVAGQLAASESVTLTPEEQEELADSLTNVTVDRIAFRLVQTESEAAGSVEVRVSDYEQPTVDYLRVAANSTEALNQSRVDRLETTLEAREAADLRQTLSWDASYTAGETEPSRLQATLEYDSTNWEAYTSELADRGMPVETDVTFEGQAQTRDGNIEANLTFQVARDEIVDSAIQQAVSAAEGSDASSSTVETLQALDDADLQVAKTDVVLGEERVEVRAAAQFEDLSELESTVADLPGDASVTHVYSDRSSDDAATYVYVENLDMSAAELRDSQLADESTTIHAPGTWSREFPTMNISATSEYLGVEVEVSYPPNSADGSTPTATPTPTPTPAQDTATEAPADTETETEEPADTDSVFGPGFGVAVAVLALLVGATLVARRRRD